jgi:hypothetical protein
MFGRGFLRACAALGDTVDFHSRGLGHRDGFEGRALGVNGTAHVLAHALIGTPRAMLDVETRVFD